VSVTDALQTSNQFWFTNQDEDDTDQRVADADDQKENPVRFLSLRSVRDQ
jgi:hypothetical protein